MKPTLAAALSALLVSLPLGASAAGSDPKPPKTTNTTAVCAEGRVYDEKLKGCVLIQDSRLDDGTIETVRELAYAGRLNDARGLLDRMDPEDGMVLTYKGFAARKMGASDVAQTYYLAALELDPDNILARSYMGQGLVSQGDMAGARAQLAEIVVRGGEGSWPAAALRDAIAGGPLYDY